jgi:hypothetical protein
MLGDDDAQGGAAAAEHLRALAAAKAQGYRENVWGRWTKEPVSALEADIIGEQESLTANIDW